MKYTKFSDIPQFTHDGNYQANYRLPSLVRYINEEIKEMGLQLNPKFQRGHVWTEEQQIAWLEYHLRGGKSGNTLYFNNPYWLRNKPEDADYTDYVCVNGLQRITAVQRFINNKIKVFGSYYNEYEDKVSLTNCGMTVCVNDLKTEREVLQWYIDMNSGGTPHSSEEIKRVKKMMEGL